MDRSSAWELLCEYTQSESLRKHALAVETAVRAYSRKFGEDEELWGITALLHDFDYEQYPTPEPPDGHPYRGNAILKEKGYPDELRRAIMSHADYTGVPRETRLEKTLFACDELCGFITAVALVKPSRSVREVEVKSVRKKMKDKAFAAKVSRDDIVHGAEGLGIELDEHIGFVLAALKENAQALGL
jgi:putative nucleotidyltransferase with HDIG domain